MFRYDSHLLNQDARFLPVIVEPSNRSRARFVGASCKKGYLDTVRQLKCWSGQLIIGEDCSTDRTRQRVKDYQRQYPDKIRLFLPERNMGQRHNFLQTLKACRGSISPGEFSNEPRYFWTN